jgi:hypothetical protein
LRRLGQGGKPVGTSTPGTTGRTRLDGISAEDAIDTVEVVPEVPAGWVSPKDHTGCAPFGAAMVMRMRDPVR